MAMASGSYTGPQFSSYGAVPGAPHNHAQRELETGLFPFGKDAKKDIAPGQSPRVKTTISSICMNLLFPWILFSLLYADLTFSLHYRLPWVCWLVAALGVVVVLAIGALAMRKVQVWLWFLALTSLLAAVSGILLGDMNYWQNMQPYYDLQTLNAYNTVNPQKTHGKHLMDAGIVEFVKDATLDLNKAYKFDDFDQYCVAPITVSDGDASPSALESYDFWAVGLNCCDGNRTGVANFRCGAYQRNGGQGLRLMTENQREFYKLAVEQAEAAYKIKANYPLFFYWSQHAEQDLQSYAQTGNQYFLVGIGLCFFVQAFLLLGTLVCVSKVGY